MSRIQFSPLLHSALVDRTIQLPVGIDSETMRAVMLAGVVVAAADAVGHQEEVGIALEQGDSLRNVEEEGRRGTEEAFLGVPRLTRVATSQSPVASLGDFVSIVSQNQWLEKHEHQRIRSGGKKVYLCSEFPIYLLSFHDQLAADLVARQTNLSFPSAFSSLPTCVIHVALASVNMVLLNLLRIWILVVETWFLLG